jgi:homoserine trans-succinylase
MKFDDPHQEAPFWVGTNNVVLNTPFPGIQIKALAIVDSSQAGVFLSGTRRVNVFAIQEHLKRDRSSLLKELPRGTTIKIGDRWPITRYKDDLKSDQEKQVWIMETMNAFANVLRPRLRRWYDETRRSSS